jgi:hypothetical protein
MIIAAGFSNNWGIEGCNIHAAEEWSFNCRQVTELSGLPSHRRSLLEPISRWIAIRNANYRVEAR